jgi:peptide/histidine transporter 3/4
LDKAATASEAERGSEPGSCSPWRLVTVTQVEEVKFILRILPIWFCSIIFSAIYTQMLTLFIVQGATMDTRVGRYNVPPASISLFDFISVLCWAPIYEWLLVPLARRYSGHERGFTGLQRMGIGLAIVTIAMVAAASVEIQRLKTAKFHNLLDAPDVPVPISIFWCVNQFSASKFQHRITLTILCIEVSRSYNLNNSLHRNFKIM